MRRTAREIAFMLIYEEQFNKKRDVEFSFNFLKSEKSDLNKDDESFIKEVLSNYSSKKQEIDVILNESLYGYEPDRVYKVDIALLYLAIVEILYIKTPHAIVINEVIEIAKVYSTEKSAKFINGILGKIVSKI